MKRNVISEENIKSALEELAAEAPVPDHLFAEVMSRKESLDAPNTATLINTHHSLNFLGGTAAATCAIFISLVLLFNFSSDVRAATVNAVNAVKSIFVVEQKGAKYVAVEKPAKEVLVTTGCSDSTSLSDSELSEKVGFKVSFPTEFYSNFKLHEKTTGVKLEKQVDYEKAQQLASDLQQAITNDAIFEKLKEYSPSRNVGCLYVNKEGDRFAISIGKAESAPNTQVNSNAPTYKYRWFEFPYAKFPTTLENGTRREDRSKKPQSISVRHSLYWEFNGLYYSLHPLDSELSWDEATKIADSFMLFITQ